MDRHGHELELPGEEEDDFAGSVCGCDEDSDLKGAAMSSAAMEIARLLIIYNVKP